MSRNSGQPRDERQAASSRSLFWSKRGIDGACHRHIRPTPNHEFIHHWPGIPSGSSDVKAAHVQGSIEVVPVKLKGAKSISLTLHLKKLETVASKGQGVNRYKEILNSQVLWRATSGKRKVLADDANAVVQLLQQKEVSLTPT